MWPEPAEAGEQVIPESIPGLNPLHLFTLRSALDCAHRLSFEEVLGLLLFYGSHARYYANSVRRSIDGGPAFDQMLEAARSYVSVGRMELEDIRKSLPEEPGPLLEQSVGRMAIVLSRFSQGVERMAAKRMDSGEIEGLGKNVVGLVGAYTAIGQEIETQLVNLRATLQPDTDPAVGESLHAIAACVERMKSAGGVQSPDVEEAAR